jgi:hypothetical protein
LTTLFGSTSVVPVAVSTEKKKRGLLPVLTVLFLFSYGLMTFLIIQQGSVIQSQRNLIKTLSRDSTELWNGKGKAIGDQQTARSQAQAHAQSPSSRTPSNQAAPQRRLQSGNGKVQLPPVPASDLVDRRRNLNSI